MVIQPSITSFLTTMGTIFLSIIALILGALIFVPLFTVLSVFSRHHRSNESGREISDTAHQSYADAVKENEVQGISEQSHSDVVEGQDTGVEQTFGEGEHATTNPILPYYAGNILRLETTKLSNSSGALPSKFAVTILEVIEPVTISPVMKVVFKDSSGREKIAILKLYDRRITPDYRTDYENKFPSWDLAREEEYRKAVKCGQVTACVEWLNAGEPDDDGDDFDERMGNEIAQDEAEVYRHSLRTYTHELAVYERLEDLQGQDIPQLFASVRLDQSSLDPTIPTDSTAKYFEIYGLLMEYIDGFPMFDLGVHAPSQSWQLVVDDALEIVNRITDHDIVNDDVRVRNMIIRKADNEAGYKAVMIDFGLGKFRDPDAPDLEWREAKYYADEETAIGRVMESILQKIKPGVVKHKEKYGRRNYRWLGAHTFESPRAYQEWLLENPDMALEGIAEDALRKFVAEGTLICPLEDFKSDLTPN
ncbi:MAG: hypothetical protein M1836_005233 [Candelina mexicana]|nr:MAG: hypothetical protein M1836_005233 [Candelina mexicana]